MESSRPFLKIAVLSVFIILLSGFVAYRSGAFDNYLHPKSPANEGILHISGIELADAEPDTTIPPRRIMPSSKSMVLPESRVLPAKYEQTAVLTLDTIQFLKLYKDLKKIKREDSLWQERNQPRISSSKSMTVIKPNDVRVRYIEPVLIQGRYRILSIREVDLLLTEMDKTYPIFASPDSIKISAPFMAPSSKSGAILSPKDFKKYKKAKRKQEKNSQ